MQTRWNNLKQDIQHTERRGTAGMYQ